MDQITSKNCIKSIWMQVNKILLNRDRPEQFPSFFGCSLQWNQTTMRWSRVPKAYHFLRVLANCAASISLFLWFLKLHFEISRKRSHRISSNFAIIEAIIVGTYSLKRFLQKTPGTEKHNDKWKTKWRHYVAMATPIAIKPRS